MPPSPILTVNQACEAVAEHGSIMKAAAALGVARSTLRRALHRADPEITDADAAEESARRAQGLEDQVRELRAQLRQARREGLTNAEIRQEIFGLAGAEVLPPAWMSKTNRAGRKSKPSIPTLFLSDLHYGEYVSASETRGLNHFDLETADKRIAATVDRAVDLCKHHMVNTDYPGIICALGGDMISGDIHAELKEANELRTMPTVVRLAGVLVAVLRRLADEFGQVFVPAVIGNHGRNTMKPVMKGRAHTSFEWLMYQMIEAQLKDDARICMHISAETDVLYSVFGHRYLLTHGDALGVRGGDGIIGAIGPIMRGQVKLRNSESQIGRDFDTVIMGHWHQLLWLPGCIVNGTLKGYDEFTRLGLRAPFSEPKQALWFTHPEHGITARWEVRCEVADEKKRRGEAGSWVSVFEVA